jgi:hypothetical protein
MKTKVSQKEWNDARDKFLCAIMNSAIINSGFIINKDAIEQAIKQANELTSELYEVEEKPVQQYEKAMFMGQEVDNISRPIITEDHVPNVGNKAEDTRPFNPKVVEIFNEFLPKEIAPLAVEAHKIYFSAPVGDIETDVSDLEKALGSNVVATFKEIDDFYRLWKHTKHNTITATPEQLREWFPQAYENKGGTND